MVTVGPAEPASLFPEHRHYEALLHARDGEPPVPTAVVYPVDEPSLRGAVATGKVGLIRPVLVGPGETIRAVAAEHAIDLEGCEIVDAVDDADAARTAVRLAAAGTVQLIEKGSLRSSTLLHAVLDRAAGLRGSTRVSHVFAFDVPAYAKPILVTDAVVNIAPDLRAKAAICQHAIDLAHLLGTEEPKVAILSAIEMVDPDIPSTIDAAALCKMAERGQITGGVLEGPLAMDDAISPAAAATKHLTSVVAGNADILVVPDVDAGNILYKDLTYLAGAVAAGVVLGAKVPIILTSRADDERTRIASAALACLVVRHNATTR